MAVTGSAKVAPRATLVIPSGMPEPGAAIVQAGGMAAPAVAEPTPVGDLYQDLIDWHDIDPDAVQKAASSR